MHPLSGVVLLHRGAGLGALAPGRLLAQWLFA
jgi:hypothetical protein